ncbi:MAG: CBS domain-containing protein [Pirellulales bacterium]|nr:CBS domain-containing protein [Pirellulales bacterium]
MAGLKPTRRSTIRQIVSRFSSLLRENAANAVVEYSLIVAVVAAVVILAASSLAPKMFDGIVASGSDWHRQAHDMAARAKNDDGQKANDPQPIEFEADRPVPWFQFGLVSAALLAGGAYFVERHRVRRKAEQEAEEAEEQRFRSEVELDPVQQPRFIAKRQQILRFITKRHTETNTRMRVGDVMTPKLTVVPRQMKVAELRQLIQDEQVRHVLVTNPNGSLAGVISDRDIAARSGARAEDLMTADPLSVEESLVVSEAIRLMVCHGISCLPVTQGDFPMGLLTTTDLLLTFQCAQQLLKQVASAAPHPERSCAEGLADFSSTELQANLQA